MHTFLRLHRSVDYHRPRSSYTSRGEINRLVNHASQILVATVSLFKFVNIQEKVIGNTKLKSKSPYLGCLWVIQLLYTKLFDQSHSCYSFKFFLQAFSLHIFVLPCWVGYDQEWQLDSKTYFHITDNIQETVAMAHDIVNRQFSPKPRPQSAPISRLQQDRLPHRPSTAKTSSPAVTHPRRKPK